MKRSHYSCAATRCKAVDAYGQVEKRCNAEERRKRQAEQLPAKRPSSGQPADSSRLPKKRPLARVLKAQTPQLLLLARRLLAGGIATAAGHAPDMASPQHLGACAGGAAHVPGSPAQTSLCVVGAVPQQQQLLQRLVDALRQAPTLSAAPPGASAGPSASSGARASDASNQPHCILEELVAKMRVTSQAAAALGKPLPKQLRAPTAAFTAARDPFAPPSLSAATGAPASSATGSGTQPGRSADPAPRAARPAGHARLSAAPSMVCAACEQSVAALGQGVAWACTGECRRVFHGACTAQAATRPVTVCQDCAASR